jgi:hypothetical protein
MGHGDVLKIVLQERRSEYHNVHFANELCSYSFYPADRRGISSLSTESCQPQAAESILILSSALPHDMEFRPSAQRHPPTELTKKQTSNWHLP